MNSETMRRCLAICMVAAVSWVSSVHAAEPVVTSSPNDEKDLLAAGFGYLYQLRPDRAINCFVPLLVHAGAKDLKNRANAQQTARYFVLIGRAFLFDENVPAAAQAFQAARALDPDNLYALAYLADSLSHGGRDAEARPLYKLLEAAAPHSLVATRALALDYLRGAEFSKAEAVLHNVIKLKETPGNWKWHELMGRTLAREGDTVGGANEHLIAARLCPEPYEAKLLQQAAAGWQAQYDVQEARLREAGKLMPQDGLWRSDLAGAFQAHKLKNAPVSALYREAVQCPRLSIRAYFSFGSYMDSHKKEDLALKCAQYLRRLAPWDESLYRLEVQIYTTKHDLAATQKCYEEMLQLHPHLAMAYISYADFCLANNLQDKAMSVLEQCVGNLPGCVYGWRRLGDMYLKQGRWQECKTCFDKALAEFPHHLTIKNPIAQDEFSRCHAGLGAYFYRLKDSQKAQEQAVAFNQLKYVPDLPGYLKIFKIRPDHIDLSKMQTKDRQVADHVLLADMLYQTGNLNDCISEYKKAVELNPDDVDLHCYLFSVYNEAGNYIAAAQEDVQLSNKLVGKMPHEIGKFVEGKKATDNTAQEKNNSEIEDSSAGTTDDAAIPKEKSGTANDDQPKDENSK